MTTTDTDALKEIIAAALWNRALDNGERIIPDCHVLAAAVLPIVADEVRKAKAEALREAATEIEGMGVEPWNALTPATRALRFRATEYETGDSNDHQ